MEQIAAYTLRPVQEKDEALLLAIYSSARADEMALLPWDAALKQAFLQMQFSAQQKHYRSYFPQAAHNMILAEGRPVGRLYVDRRETAIHILDVTLLPRLRRARRLLLPRSPVLSRCPMAAQIVVSPHSLPERVLVILPFQVPDRTR
ncbi:MAG: hypothetical protein AUJ21_03710 [Anaerolineae bacterium CG1_02_58_13]|nr:MAG: hypothetical protein AUJ21_03710 [Anaerolineae bacterium CG1_02_58_13]